MVGRGFGVVLLAVGTFFDVGPGVKQTQRFTHVGNTARGTTYKGTAARHRKNVWIPFPTAGINANPRKTNSAACIPAVYKHLSAKCRKICSRILFQSIGKHSLP